MRKIFFMLMFASMSHAKSTCPPLMEHTGNTPLTPGEVQTSIVTLSKLESDTDLKYAIKITELEKTSREASQRATEDLRNCGDDSECRKRVAEQTKVFLDSLQEQISEIKKEQKTCNDTFTFIYQTVAGSALANTIRDLIKFWEARGYVKLVGDVNLIPIKDAELDSLFFNLGYARKNNGRQYDMGSVGLWYDLETSAGVVRVAGVVHSNSPKYFLTEHLKKRESSIERYGFDLDRLEAKFVKGRIKYYFSFHWNFPWTQDGIKHTGMWGYIDYSRLHYYSDARIELLTYEAL